MMMNLILHNILDAQIEFGDTLLARLNVRDGHLLQFDRVIANPPSSQNYNRAAMQRPERFNYGFAPETGSKAGLMFELRPPKNLKLTEPPAMCFNYSKLVRYRAAAAQGLLAPS